MKLENNWRHKTLENLFAEALYEGDLLEGVLRVRAEFWRQNKQL